MTNTYFFYAHSVAKIRVYPMQADNIVCPIPHISAYTGDICKLDALWTNAIAALLTIPLVAGDTTPNNKINIEKNRPNLCLRSVTNAMNAAHVWTKTEEYKLQINMWYHISANVFKMITSVAGLCFAIGSSINIVFILLIAE